MRVPTTLPITMSPEAAETLRESLGGGPGQRGGPMWRGRLGKRVCGSHPVLCPGAPRSLSLAGDWRVKKDAISPEARRPASARPARGSHRAPAPPGETDLGGGSPPTPSRAAREGQWGGEPPVTEHAVRLSRQDPSPRPSPPLCRPLLLTNAGFGGVRRGNGKRSAQGLQCKGASAAARPHPGPRAPGREVGAGLDAEPSARAGVRWRSHAKLCHPGKTTASGRSQGCPAPGPGG